MEIDISKPIEIDDGVFWVGFDDVDSGLHCNPYVLVDDGEAIFFDPGSIPHFPQVLQKLVKVIDIKQITHMVVTHQDPDLCAALPRFEELIYGTGGSCKIVAHTRASVLIAHYGIRSEFYNIDLNDWKLTLLSGRELQFVFAPYLHFPGAYMTYDPTSKILFSGDLFGAFSFDWQLYANEYYIEAMKAFHENYMPSNAILRATMGRLDPLDIKMIAPQHGSIIKENVSEYIEILRNLDCGDYILNQD